MIFGSRNCSVVPETTPTDAGVAGPGVRIIPESVIQTSNSSPTWKRRRKYQYVINSKLTHKQVLLTFIFTNFLSLSLSAIIILLGLRKSTSAPISRKLLLSFSDQQILTGIGIQCVALAKMSHMVPYHFFIIWLLSLLSTATNLATLLALVNDFRRDWVLRWLRQAFMAANLVLQSVLGVLMLRSVMKNLEPRLPIACVFEVESRGASGNAALSIAGTIAVIAANLVLFVASTWYLHASKNPRWLKPVQVVGLFLLVAMGVGATVRVVRESQAFGSPPASVRLEGEGEREWGFGQLLGLLMLVLPGISALEVVRGEVKAGYNKADEDGELEIEKTPLVGQSAWGR
jgi:hypothetical protein